MTSGWRSSTSSLVQSFPLVRGCWGSRIGCRSSASGIRILITLLRIIGRYLELSLGAPSWVLCEIPTASTPPTFPRPPLNRESDGSRRVAQRYPRLYFEVVLRASVRQQDGVPDTHFSIGDGIQAPDSDHEFVRKSGCLELPNPGRCVYGLSGGLAPSGARLSTSPTRVHHAATLLWLPLFQVCPTVLETVFAEGQSHQSGGRYGTEAGSRRERRLRMGWKTINDHRYY